jgi:hypothetical protein
MHWLLRPTIDKERSAMFNIVNAHVTIQEKLRDAILGPVRNVLSNELILNACRHCGHRWRRRRFCPVVSLLACVFKHLASVSARSVEDHLALLGQTNPSLRDGRDFCNARARLPILVFQRAMKHLALAASNADALHYKQMRVCLVDGTTARTQRTDPNRKAFHASTNQHGKSRSPVMRVVILVCAGCGAIFDVAFSPYTVAEARLFALLVCRLASNTLLIADTTACSFMNFAIARSRGSHMLCPLRPDRKRLISKRLSAGETLECWPKPEPGKIAYPLLLKPLPDAIEVRVIECIVHRKGYRDYKLTLATTLLDPLEFPRHELLALYLQRWNIECDIRTLKHEHGLETLTGKTPQIVCREMFSAILAYNAVRVLMCAQSGGQTRRLSHTRVQTMILQSSSHMAVAAVVRIPQMFKILLESIRTAVAPKQERPPEPRAILQRHRSFPYLQTSRKTWRAKYRVA